MKKTSLIGGIVMALLGIVFLGAFLYLFFCDRSAPEPKEGWEVAGINDDAEADETSEPAAQTEQEDIDEDESVEDTSAEAQNIIQELMSEEEYDQAIETYRSEGDNDSAVAALWEKYVLYPSLENAALLEEAVFVMKDSVWVGDFTALIPVIEEMDYDVDSVMNQLKMIVDSAEFQADFLMEDGAITKHTVAVSDAGSLYVVMKRGEMQIVVLSAGGSGLLVTQDKQGYKLLIAETTELIHENDNDYVDFTGGFSAACYDTELTNTAKLAGTLKDGYLIREFVLSRNDRVYYGSLDENGNTQAEQQEVCYGVVFAYTEDGMVYLYSEESSQDDFRLTTQYIGVSSTPMIRTLQ